MENKVIQTLNTRLYGSKNGDPWF